jgi:superoxide dismutase
MRLYKVMDMADREDDVVIRSCLVPTNAEFKDSAAFHAEIERDGKTYAGQSWVLLSEDQADRVVTVEAETKYRAVVSK